MIDNVATGRLSSAVHGKRHVHGHAWHGDERFKTGGVRKRLALRFRELSGADAQVAGADERPRCADEGREQRGAQHGPSVVFVCVRVRCT